MKWWMFRLPAAVGFASGETQAEAIAKMRRACYTGAPIDSWACPVFLSDDQMAKALVGGGWTGTVGGEVGYVEFREREKR